MAVTEAVVELASTRPDHVGGSSCSSAPKTALAIVDAAGNVQVPDRPGSQRISEAILWGLERFPLGPERSAACAKRRKDVRAALPQLARVLERTDEALRLKTNSGEQGARAEYGIHKQRVEWVLDRYKGLLFALRTLEAHDRLCRASSSIERPLAPSARAREEEIIAAEYALLRADIDSRQARAAGLLAQLEGNSFSFSQILAWTFLWLVSPVVYLGGSLASCAYRPVAMIAT